MKTMSFLIVGTAALLLAGGAIASERESQLHEMTVRLPDGGVARIAYTGNVKPQVTFDRMAGPFEHADWIWQRDPAFTELNRISVQMNRFWANFDRDMSAMMASTRQAPDGQPIDAAIRNMPAGSASYSFISTSNFNAGCMQTVEITQRAGAKPQVVRQSSGDCQKSGASTSTAPSTSAGLINATAHETGRLEPAILH